MDYSAETLRFPGRAASSDGGLRNRVDPASAGWELLHAELRSLAPGERYTTTSDDSELAVVVLSGVARLSWNPGSEARVGGRQSVFDGMPWALYVSRGTEVAVVAETPTEFAIARVATDEDHPPQLIRPQDVEIEIRGGHNNSRQINQIIPPGFDCHRIVCVEVYTPSGNWSSYPPHKHDKHRESGGTLLEADLEETYLYKFDRPDGWALQRVYTDDGSIDATVVARDGDIVLVPRGYHPVCTGYGYDCYYLNFLAGSAQSLACVDDPAHAWVKETWTAVDPRVPMVTLEMESARSSAK